MKNGNTGFVKSKKSPVGGGKKPVKLFIKKYLVACQNHGIKEYFLISIKVRVTYHSFNSIS